MRTRVDTKIHGLFVVGIFAHIVSILFIALYTTLDDLDITSIVAHHIDGISIERDLLLHGVTILTLLLLYISFALRLTWPMRFEEAIAIIVIWSWFGNVFGNHQHHNQSFDLFGYSPCDDNAPPHHVHSTINETVIIASDVVNHHPPIISHHPVCGWNLFNLYFSLLCLFSAVVSFLSDTRSYCVSFLLKTLSVLTTILIFFVPIACNRFRMISTPILILKITLYNIAWNMNRYMVETQGDIASDYNKGNLIMRGYESIYRGLVVDSFYRHERLASHGDEEDDEEEEDEGDEDDDTEEGDEEEDGVFSVSKRNAFKIFQTLEKTNTTIRKVSLHRHQRSSSSQLRNEQVPVQINHFKELCKINRRYRPSCFFSWKNRSYDDRLSDFARTIWILALCPLYLFTVILFLMVLWYYTRRGILELNAIRKTVTSMEKIIK